MWYTYPLVVELHSCNKLLSIFSSITNRCHRCAMSSEFGAYYHVLLLRFRVCVYIYTAPTARSLCYSKLCMHGREGWCGTAPPFILFLNVNALLILGSLLLSTTVYCCHNNTTKHDCTSEFLATLLTSLFQPIANDSINIYSRLPRAATWAASLQLFSILRT